MDLKFDHIYFWLYKEIEIYKVRLSYVILSLYFLFYNHF